MIVNRWHRHFHHIQLQRRPIRAGVVQTYRHQQGRALHRANDDFDAHGALIVKVNYLIEFSRVEDTENMKNWVGVS